MATSRQRKVAKAAGIALPSPAPAAAAAPEKPRIRVPAGSRRSLPNARSEFFWSNQAINTPFEALDPGQKLPRPPNSGPNATIIITVSASDAH